jgi:vancomycin resistance protein VanJ
MEVRAAVYHTARPGRRAALGQPPGSSSIDQHHPPPQRARRRTGGPAHGPFSPWAISTGGPGRAAPWAGPLVALGWVYLGGLHAWAAASLLFGDRWWWLFLLNSFAPYLFLPLPAVLGVAVATRRRGLGVGLAAGLLLFAGLYGHLFQPRARLAPAGAPAVVAMTWNIQGQNTDVAPMLAAVRASGADLIAFQELNHVAAAGLERALDDLYPYRVLAPQSGVLGMGVLSRYPLRASGARLSPVWGQTWQVLEMEVDGHAVTVVNVHAVASFVHQGPAALTRSIRDREGQAAALDAFVAARPGPLICLGDLNTTDRTVAYALATGRLRDAWREAGWGLGHTFPGAAVPGSGMPTVAGRPLLPWLVRIDHVLHSAHWLATEARIGPWDGIADHRPVMARLVLVAAAGAASAPGLVTSGG